MNVHFVGRCLLLFLVQVHANKTNRTVTDIIGSLLNSSVYKSRVRPFADEGLPLTIFINVNINEISSVNEVDMEYSMTCFIRQMWTDMRLLYTDYNNSIILNYNYFDQIWTSDLYIENSKSAVFHTVTVPNRHIRIFPQGRVFYSQRLTIKIICNMILDKYPMDNQTCHFDLASYAYTVQDLLFRWDNTRYPIEMGKDFSLSEYEITGTSFGMCASEFSTGSFPCLRGFFYLKRRLKAYILGTYLPSLLVVLLSWLSFWIDPQSTPARTSLSILTILTITTQSSSLAKSSPAGSFTKASDFWMAACLVFVFAAFIEFSVVNTLSRKRKRNKKNVVDISRDESISQSNDGEKGQKGKMNIMEYFKILVKEKFSNDPATTVESISRILFPTLFAVFNVIYWSYYLK